MMRLRSWQSIEVVLLQDVLASCSGQAIATQRNLDAAYLAALGVFKEFLAWALPAGLGEIAHQFEPQHFLLQEQQLQFQITTWGGTLEEVQVVNQTFMQRYRTRTTTHSITMNVLRSAPRISAGSE